MPYYYEPTWLPTKLSYNSFQLLINERCVPNFDDNNTKRSLFPTIDLKFPVNT